MTKCAAISPASGAPTSFIFALMTEWPVFHISGLPPAAAMPSNSASLHFTSPMTVAPGRSEEHTSELRSPMRISSAVFCLKKKKNKKQKKQNKQHYMTIGSNQYHT